MKTGTAQQPQGKTVTALTAENAEDGRHGD
jgi:hypothetical protein